MRRLEADSRTERDFHEILVYAKTHDGSPPPARDGEQAIEGGYYYHG